MAAPLGSEGDMGKSSFSASERRAAQQQDMQVFVGHEGKTLSVLRPSGIGDFDGVRLNVVTEGEFIENGTPIRIVRVEGGKIVVKAM
ncbi:MAG: NfeD family protein [Christensenellales bacterium]